MKPLFLFGQKFTTRDPLLITHTVIGLLALNSKLVTLKQSYLRTTATKLWIANFQLMRPSN